MESVEQSISNPLRCYKYQKYSHHEDNGKGPEVCEKCGQQKLDHRTNE